TSRESPLPLPPFAWPFSVASVRKTPVRCNMSRSELRLGASLSPFTAFPAAVIPLYSWSGIGFCVAQRVDSGEFLKSGAFVGDAQHFFNRGEALQDLVCAVFAHRDHAIRLGKPLDARRIRAVHDHTPDVVVHLQHLVD